MWCNDYRNYCCPGVSVWHAFYVQGIDEGFPSAPSLSLRRYIQLQDESNDSSRNPHDYWNRGSYRGCGHHRSRPVLECWRQCMVFHVVCTPPASSTSISIRLSSGLLIGKIYSNSLLASLNSRAPIFQIESADVVTSGGSIWNSNQRSTIEVNESHVKFRRLNGGGHGTSFVDTRVGNDVCINTAKSSKTEGINEC